MHHHLVVVGLCLLANHEDVVEEEGASHGFGLYDFDVLVLGLLMVEHVGVRNTES